VTIDNRPGLSGLTYRCGTYGEFLSSMLSELSSSNLPALAGLQTRSSDDFSIALLDAFAVMADVLTFYQERIANESFLRTASERRSVLELARELGYELRPAVAAGTHLAFTVDDAKGAPSAVNVAVGTSVHSVPGPGEKAQTYETVEALDARVEWNVLRARQTQSIQAPSGPGQAYFSGVATGLASGDLLLFTLSSQWTVLRVSQVEQDPARQITRVSWRESPVWHAFGVVPAPDDARLSAWVFRRRAVLFGSNAPDWLTMPDSIRARFDPSGNATEWPHLALSLTSSVNAASTGLRGDYFEDTTLTSLLESRVDSTIDFTDFREPLGTNSPIDNKPFSVRWRGWLVPAVSGSYTLYTFSDDGVRLSLDGQTLIDAWSDRPRPSSPDASVALTLQAGKRYRLVLEYYQNLHQASVELDWSGPGIGRQPIPGTQLVPYQDIQIAPPDPQIAGNRWLVLAAPDHAAVCWVDAITEDSRADFSLASKTTRVSLIGESLSNHFDDQLRQTTVYGGSERLTLVRPPDTSPVAATASGAEPELTLDVKADALSVGRALLLSGPDSSGVQRAELALVKRVDTSDPDFTRLLLETPIMHDYDRAKLAILGNVAYATHGETVSEIVGSGEAAASFQSFQLKSAPVTYIGAATARGAESTLRVQVGGGQWQEVPTLYGRGPREHVFVSQIDDEAKSTITFGDGSTGARLPNGTENVTAVYRKGGGVAGQVAANRLSLLVPRPLGLKGVNNPIAASGAQDAEQLADARANAPRGVLTLDRVVSLTDYRDFALSFAGVAKALATWVWSGESRAVLLSAAALDRTSLVQGSDPHDSLLSAIALASVPKVRVLITQPESYRQRTFTVAADVRVDPALASAEAVVEAVQAALFAQFGFAARDFGQGVGRSEVIAIIQAIAGVTMVDLRRFHRDDSVGSEPDYLRVEVPASGDDANGVKPAELLILNETTLDITVLP